LEVKDLTIISGGQTGVDRAALDAAMQMGFDVGGWCPKSRRAEDGPLDLKYPLSETTSDSYEDCTELNVRDSDGTLILIWGAPEAKTQYTNQMIEKCGKPSLQFDLMKRPSSQKFKDWIKENKIEVLNVTGPRADFRQGVYQDAKSAILEFLRAFVKVPRAACQAPE
jgi:hypothetical protein